MLSEYVILFDIDGTLVRRSGPHHRDALVGAIRRVFGMSVVIDGIPVHGMLDRGILSAMLRREGVAETDIAAALPELARSAADLYLADTRDMEPLDLAGCICPGVRELLEGLKGAGVPVGLVTGNFSRIAWRKLTRAGLESYFAFGGFAEMGKTRGELVLLALDKAREMGLIRPDAGAALIGDAPSDVEAARAAGITSISVHTGISGPDVLAACGPDTLLADLSGVNARTLIEMLARSEQRG